LTEWTKVEAKTFTAKDAEKGREERKGSNWVSSRTLRLFFARTFTAKHAEKGREERKGNNWVSPRTLRLFFAHFAVRLAF
jgi:hypothetical protein